MLRWLVRCDSRSEDSGQETISCACYKSNTHSAGVQPVAQSLNRPSLKVKLSEVTSLPCVSLQLLTVRFSWVSTLYNMESDHVMRCLPNIRNVTTYKNRVLEGVEMEYTPTRAPWAGTKRISSLQLNYISFAPIQYLNTQPVTLYSQTARPQTLCIKLKSEKFAFLGYHSASIDHILSTFRHNISVPSSRIKH